MPARNSSPEILTPINQAIIPAEVVKSGAGESHCSAKMKRLTPLVLALVCLSGCASAHLPYEKKEPVQIVGEVFALGQRLDLTTNEVTSQFREVLPVGTSRKDVLRKLSAIKQRHLYATDFGSLPDDREITFRVFRFTRNGMGPYYEEGIELFFRFDALGCLRSVDGMRVLNHF